LTALTDRYGINLSISKPVPGSGSAFNMRDTMYYATADDSYFMNYILLANNTIVMEEDARQNSQGDYYGLKLQKIRNSRAVNNAIELADTTQFYPSLSNKFAAAVYYQGPSPEEVNNMIDYNIYSYRRTSGSSVDAYRYVNTDITGVVVDLGYRDEYNTLNNWQNWMHTDVYSNTKSFMNDLQKIPERFPRLRINRNPVPTNSPLDRTGIYLAEAETDIDGANRNYADQRLDIGAELVSGNKYSSDIEVLNIYSPATYKANRGPWSDAEYFMIKNEPIKVRALVRNNANNAAINKRITLRIFQEPSAVNNENADIHTKNYTTNYYNNERAHNRDASDFREIPTSVTPFFMDSKNVTITSGEGMYIEFQLDKTFNTY
jgi:hypothetical protein